MTPGDDAPRRRAMERSLRLQVRGLVEVEGGVGVGKPTFTPLEVGNIVLDEVLAAMPEGTVLEFGGDELRVVRP